MESEKKQQQNEQPFTLITRAMSAKQRGFLKAVEKYLNISAAAKAVKIDRMTHYRIWMRDPAYAAAFKLACDTGIEALEDLAHERVVEGWDEPVFGTLFEDHVSPEGKVTPIKKWGVVGFKRKFSETLHVLLLKAHKPDRYRERLDIKADVNLNMSIASKLAAGRERLARDKGNREGQSVGVK